MAVPSHVPFDAAVAEALARVAPGDVVSYGQLARLAGRPGAARAVGAVMRRSTGLPWWRVVHADGTLVAGLERRQARLLQAEGVLVRGPQILGRDRGPGPLIARDDAGA